MFLYSVAIITHTRHLVNKGTCYYFSLALLRRKIGKEKMNSYSCVLLDITLLYFPI